MRRAPVLIALGVASMLALTVAPASAQHSGGSRGRRRARQRRRGRASGFAVRGGWRALRGAASWRQPCSTSTSWRRWRLFGKRLRPRRLRWIAALLRRALLRGLVLRWWVTTVGAITRRPVLSPYYAFRSRFSLVWSVYRLSIISLPVHYPLLLPVFGFPCPMRRILRQRVSGAGAIVSGPCSVRPGVSSAGAELGRRSAGRRPVEHWRPELRDYAV
jgi:hypothetical protein